MDKLQIINMALLETGLPPAATLADIDWNAREVYEPCVNSLLTGHTWNFAQRLATLEELEEQLPFGYRHQYQLPDDYIQIIDCRNVFDIRAPTIDGTIMGKTFCANARPCHMRYIARRPEEDWPVYFCFALSSLIASRIAGLSAEKMSLVPQLLQLHLARLQEAIAADSRGTFERLQPDMSYMKRRNQSGGNE